MYVHLFFPGLEFFFNPHTKNTVFFAQKTAEKSYSDDHQSLMSSQRFLFFECMRSLKFQVRIFCNVSPCFQCFDTRWSPMMHNRAQLSMHYRDWAVMREQWKGIIAIELMSRHWRGSCRRHWWNWTHPAHLLRFEQRMARAAGWAV